jgi:hypothetical protein
MEKNLAFLVHGTAVNAVNASKALTVSGVVIDGETVTIDNPLRLKTDVYEFLADTAQTKTSPTNKAVDITASTTKSTGTLTVPTQPTAGDTMTIGTTVYTFIADNGTLAGGKIKVGADLAGAKLNIVAAINGTDGKNTPNPKVSASAFAANICTLTALVGGVAGDAIATTETFTAVGNVFGAGTLTSGADCSAQNAVTALVAAITASDTQGVGAVDSTGGVVTLTSDIAGKKGNDIVVGETMVHGAFAGGATKLSGGVDGTDSPKDTLMIDSSYLYVCVVDDNNTSGKSWRRISLGTAF